ncbi:MAG: Hsp70 family protein, partial [Cytophagales bacterium]
QKIRIEATTGLSEQEIERMRQEAKANEEADKKEKESIEKLNQADSLAFQTEKQLKEYGDKISAEKKAPIESALKDLRMAHASKDLTSVDAAMTALNAAWEKASTELYNAMNQQGNPAGQPGTGSSGNTSNKEDVTDVNYEEVK